MRSIDDILQEGILAGQFGGESKPHGDHAMGFVAFLDDPQSQFVGHVIDIGSGAGLPALVLAVAFPGTTWTLIERRSGRTDLLARAVRRLELTDRVEVLTDDVAVVGRSSVRSTADWVTARSFGPPGDTAECAAPLLRCGGQLLASESYDADLAARWPADDLVRAGLVHSGEWTTDSGRYLRLTRTDEAIDDLPRAGARKKPLF